MLDPVQVLDRFGDEDFLRELWLKALTQLPRELAEAESLLDGLNSDRGELAKRLHKLRGLIANFLEGGEAIAALRRCEELCQHSPGGVSAESWQSFRQALRSESAQLESWLSERGFPCA